MALLLCVLLRAAAVASAALAVIVLVLTVTVSLPGVYHRATASPAAVAAVELRLAAKESEFQTHLHTKRAALKDDRVFEIMDELDAIRLDLHQAKESLYRPTPWLMLLGPPFLGLLCALAAWALWIAGGWCLAQQRQ